ncbi:MAG: YIP1 family protein [Haloarculaceae archaeon]
MVPRTPLRSPSEYFERRNRPSLAVGAGVVVAEALAITVAIWLFMQRVVARVDAPPGAESEIRSAVSGGLVAAFFGVVVGWVLLAAIVHVFMWFADAERGFGTTLAVVGEAELVGIVVLPVTTVALLNLAGQTPADPEAAAAFFRRAASFNSPLLLLVSLVSTLWKAAIQGYGLAVSHRVDAGKALVLTLVVGIVGFLLNLA